MLLLTKYMKNRSIRGKKCGTVTWRTKGIFRQRGHMIVIRDINGRLVTGSESGTKSGYKKNEGLSRGYMNCEL